jgi:hypothetical protein
MKELKSPTLQSDISILDSSKDHLCNENYGSNAYIIKHSNNVLTKCHIFKKYYDILKSVQGIDNLICKPKQVGFVQISLLEDILYYPFLNKLDIEERIQKELHKIVFIKNNFLQEDWEEQQFVIYHGSYQDFETGNLSLLLQESNDSETSQQLEINSVICCVAKSGEKKAIFRNGSYNINNLRKWFISCMDQGLLRKRNMDIYDSTLIPLQMRSWLTFIDDKIAEANFFSKSIIHSKQNAQYACLRFNESNFEHNDCVIFEKKTDYGWEEIDYVSYPYHLKYHETDAHYHYYINILEQEKQEIWRKSIFFEFIVPLELKLHTSSYDLTGVDLIHFLSQYSQINNLVSTIQYSLLYYPLSILELACKWEKSSWNHLDPSPENLIIDRDGEVRFCDLEAFTKEKFGKKNQIGIDMYSDKSHYVCIPKGIYQNRIVNNCLKSVIKAKYTDSVDLHKNTAYCLVFAALLIFYYIEHYLKDGFKSVIFDETYNTFVECIDNFDNMSCHDVYLKIQNTIVSQCKKEKVFIDKQTYEKFNRIYINQMISSVK